jgi:acetate kinase
VTRHILTLNAGSSSIKFALFEATNGEVRSLGHGLVEMLGERRRLRVTPKARDSHESTWSDSSTEFHIDAMRHLLDWLAGAIPHANIVAIGHRVVHGGMHHDQPTVATDALLQQLRDLVPLAPLHEPHNIGGIEAARQAWPNSVQVACFDTAFHRGHPFVHDTFALPRHLYEEGVRRYGFHGLSYEYIAQRLHEIAPHQAAGRVVAAHLGNGASMCAMRDGRSVASSMGFTAVDGLPMGTRTGQLDPGVVLYLLRDKGMSVAEVEDLIYTRSGLKGMSCVSHDMRELEASPRPEAAEAIDYFVARIQGELGALAAALGGLDAVVFSAGIGENAWRVRERVLESAGWLGIELDREANRAMTGGKEGVISTGRSGVRVFVIPTDEEQMIARHTLAALDGRGQRPSR